MRKKLSLIFTFVLAVVVAAVFCACAGSDTEVDPDIPKPPPEPPAAVAIAAPSVSIDGNKAVWNEVEHATGYEVYINGELEAAVTLTEYTVTAVAPGNYTVTVRAVTTESGYKNSELSEPRTYTVSGPPEPPAAVAIAAPSVSIDGNKAVWNAVEHATGYEVYINGELEATVTLTEYTVIVVAPGNYTVTVRAVTTESGYKNSELSEPRTYNVPEPVELSAPEVTAQGERVVWSEIEHATGYEVYINGQAAASVTATEYSLSDLRAAKYNVAVKALGGVGYIASALSTEVECDVAKHDPRLKKLTEPTKTEYWLDDGTASLDLTGFTAQIAYSNADPESVELSVDDIFTEYDLTAAGRYELEFRKNGIYGAGIRIYVKKRTSADVVCTPVTVLMNYTAANGWGFAESSYSVVPAGLGFVPTAAVTDRGQEFTLTDGKAEASVLPRGKTLIKLTDGSNTAFVELTVACGITTVAEFNTIANGLDGYYVLCNDLDFDNKGIQIGAVPLNITYSDAEHTKDETVSLDRTGNGDENARGVAFTGTFDGCGYVIRNFKLTKGGFSYFERHKGFGVAMFSYIGSTGTVKNFTLRGAYVSGMDYSSLVAGYNLGTVRNIAIEEDCTVSNLYWNGAIVSAFNYGRVENIVSHITGGLRGGNPTSLALIHSAAAYSDDSGINGYKGSKADLTDILGEGWRYIDGYGTVYCNSSYRKLLDYEDVWYVGVDTRFTVYLADMTVQGSRYLHSWGAYSGAVSIKNTEIDGDLVTYTVCIDSGTVGGALSAKLRYSDSGYWCTMSVTVGAPYAIGVSDATGGGITAISGAGLDLSTVDITVHYSDGSTALAHPTGYDKNTYDESIIGTAQSVTFIYKPSEDHVGFPVTVGVTAAQPMSDYVTLITVRKKNAEDKIVYGASGLDLDTWLSFTFVYASGDTRAATAADGITASYTPGKHIARFEYADPSGVTAHGELELELWYEIKTVADWDKMNDTLDGYYMLCNDLDFDQTAHSIGIMPIKDSEYSLNDLAGTGLAFTGKFDGGGFVISGFKSSYEGGFTVDLFGNTLFNYIGEGGEVYNFTVSGLVSGSCNYSAFVAGANCGVIRNVTVTGGSLGAQYGAAGAFATFNSGTVSDCTCTVTVYTELRNGSTKQLSAVFAGTGSVRDCSVGEEG